MTRTFQMTRVRQTEEVGFRSLRSANTNDTQFADAPGNIAAVLAAHVLANELARAMASTNDGFYK